MYRPKAGTLKTKWLEELKQEENFKTATRFTERNRKKYYKMVVG